MMVAILVIIMVVIIIILIMIPPVRHRIPTDWPVEIM